VGWSLCPSTPPQPATPAQPATPPHPAPAPRPPPPAPRPPPPAPRPPPPNSYEKAQKPLSSYEADINEFANKQDEVAHEETTANVKFLFIDCGPLKQALSSHCDLWRAKLTGLLNKQAAAELHALHETFRAGLEALAPAPGDLHALAEAVALHAELMEDRSRLAGRFEPLRQGGGA
jgi:hypothetical protein